MVPSKPPLRGTVPSVALIAATVLMLPATGTTGTTAHPARLPHERHVTLFYTAEVHGTVEPCGCTSDPLGDVARLAGLIDDARHGGDAVALLDAGGLLYPEGAISTKERPSADLRAGFLEEQFQRLGLRGVTLGETDALTGGAARIRSPRLASNLTGDATIVRPPRVEKIGDIAIGVLGIADPIAATIIKAKVEDMQAAAKRDVESLRQAGAEVVILLAAVDKSAARKLARDAGADIVIIGKRVGAGSPLLEQVGRAFLAAPADEIQRVGRLDIVLRTTASAGRAPLPRLEDAGGPDASRLRKQEVVHEIDRLRASLAQWTAKPADKSAGGAGEAADGTFVAQKQRELAGLEAERGRLEIPWTPPSTGNYVINTLVPLRRSLRRDPQVAAAMKKLDQRIAALNLKYAAPPPTPEPGRAYYVGMESCAGCHAGADRFWKQTVHARAWKTLVEGGKQADYKCVGCHVTGFGQVGGTSLGFTKKLESVQCETCHGPGSLHVAGEGNEEPLAIKRDTPETVCLGCHTEQHSDTFKFEPYLRDIVGQGHGLKRRETLGPGPTGHQLRTVALAKAKLEAKADARSGSKTGASNRIQLPSNPSNPIKKKM